MNLLGRVRLGKKTKDLVKRLEAGEIAIIDHEDIDQLAAESLIKKKVKAVINISQSISGKYPNLGPQKLVDAKVPVVDNLDQNLFQSLNDGDLIEVKNGVIIKDNKVIARGVILTKESLEEKLAETKDNLLAELDKFIDNTLDYAKKEKELILGLDSPEIEIDLKGKDVLIVVRGKDYRQDLEAVSSYIREVKPVLIAVDGGADALLEYGFKPALILGDMDSVSDHALSCGAELVVHAYPDGRAPGMERVKQLGLTAKTFPAPGTSEDIAMLLAYEKAAELIIAVGTHTTMIDFLEKGRPGMASTFLVRLRVGSKLIDAKGVNKLYCSKIKARHLFEVLIASLIPIIVIISVSSPINQLIKLLLIKLRVTLDF